MTEYIPTESEEHILCADYLRAAGVLFFHIPNGELRHIAVARKLKRMGVQPGVPDFFIPVGNLATPIHGLFIELKRRKGGWVNDNQKFWHEALKKEGYMVGVAHGFDEFRNIVDAYFADKHHNEGNDLEMKHYSNERKQRIKDFLAG